MRSELFEAVKAGDLAAAQRMLAAGAEVDARDAEDGTLLMLAAHLGNLPMVNALIAAGADVNAHDERGWAPLIKAAYNADQKCGLPMWYKC